MAALNSFRRARGLRPFRSSPRLHAAAVRHSGEMARWGYFEHASPNGAAFWRRIAVYYKETGFRRWTVGENLEYGQPGLGGARGAARLAREPASSRQRRLDALSRCGHRRGLRGKRRGRLRRHADDDRHPGRRLPQALVRSCARQPVNSHGHSPTSSQAPTAQLPHPGWGGRPFHPPPAASVTPKITPRSAKIGENVRQHRYPPPSVDRCRTVASANRKKSQETASIQP